MQSESDFVVLIEESNMMRAHLLAGALDEAGIPTFVDEDNAADEFAVSQRALALPRVRVCVPRGRLDEARAVQLRMSQPMPLVDEDEEEEEDEREEEAERVGARASLAIALLMVAVPFGLLLLARSCGSANDGEPSEPAQWRPHQPPPMPPLPVPPPPPILHK